MAKELGGSGGNGAEGCGRLGVWALGMHCAMGHWDMGYGVGLCCTVQWARGVWGSGL